MSVFDSIISGANEKFELGDKAGNVLSALLSLMTAQNRGGIAGFLNLFSGAGLGEAASSWIGSGPNSQLSNSQVESALGADAVNEIAGHAGISKDAATSALAYMIPKVVDKLTPDGVVPEDQDLLSKMGDFLSGFGGTAEMSVETAGTTPDAAKAATSSGRDSSIDGGGILKRLVSSIILGSVLLLGFWFCNKKTERAVPSGNTNTVKAVNSGAK